jgi:hypothetical protein
MMMKHKKTIYLMLVFVLAVSLCGAFPTEVFAAKALKGTLSGVVLNQDGKPVSNTQVYIYQRDWSNTDGFGEPDWKSLAGTATTSRNGQYKISLPAGEYKVWFVPSNLDTYAMEAYPNAPIVRLGDVVTVKYGKTTGGISVALDAAGKICGYVKDTAPGNEGQPMVDTPIVLAVQDYSIKSCLQLTSTDESGYYELKGLKPYPWEIWVNSFMFGTPAGEPYDLLNYKQGYKDYFKYAIGQYEWVPQQGQSLMIETIYLEHIDFVNIHGRLLYYDEVTQDDLPAANVTVTAMLADNPYQVSDWVDYLQATTDEYGYFEIKGFWQAYGIFILYTQGIANDNQMFYSEYYDNSNNQQGANWFELYSGYTTEVGEWKLELIPQGQNP